MKSKHLKVPVTSGPTSVDLVLQKIRDFPDDDTSGDVVTKREVLPPREISRRVERLARKFFEFQFVRSMPRSTKTACAIVFVRRGLGQWSRLIHEVAHFQVAPPYRRNKPNFGLGPFMGLGSQSLVSDDYSFIEESHASLLGILWEAKLVPQRTKILDYEDTLADHQWLGYPIQGPDPTAEEVVDNLTRLGLLVDGEPVPELRSPNTRLR